jgi:hypothetical protein
MVFNSFNIEIKSIYLHYFSSYFYTTLQFHDHGSYELCMYIYAYNFFDTLDIEIVDQHRIHI